MFPHYGSLNLELGTGEPFKNILQDVFIYSLDIGVVGSNVDAVCVNSAVEPRFGASPLQEVLLLGTSGHAIPRRHHRVSPDIFYFAWLIDTGIGKI